MTNQAGAFKILDESEMKNLERIEEIGYGGGGKVIKVAKKEVYALKEMNIKNPVLKDFRISFRNNGNDGSPKHSKSQRLLHEQQENSALHPP